MFQENEAQTVRSEGIVSVYNTVFKDDDISLNNVSNITGENENEGKNVFLLVRIPKKTYLGGYRDKATGIIYHHAKIQTLPPPWKYGFIERFCRDAQTAILCNQGQQTSRDACSQVQVRNIFIRTTGDKFLTTTQNYVYADEIQADILEKVITLQKYLRRWLAVQELHKLKKFALLQILWEKEQDKLRRKQDTEWEKDIQRRKLNPKNEEDFILLFSELQKWWNFEVKAISEARSGADLKAAMWMLVNVEAKRIEEINQMKSITGKEKQLESRNKFLTEASKPKLWKAYKDQIKVVTADTERGSNLRDLYMTLSLKCVSAKDRIDVLTRLKDSIQPYKCALTDNLTKLADREIDLLLRGIKSSHLEGLRSRIRSLFWQYAKQPSFNPEMQRLSKMKKLNGIEPHILCCAACKRFYILSANAIDESLGKSVIEKHFTKCKKCLYLENEGWIRRDLEVHKRILKLLINEEEKKPTVSSLIYILQPSDIGHLAEKIWKNQSCLSGAADENDLEFIRYNNNEDWTPWNCMLVTRQEAVTLNRMSNIEKKYDADFKKCVLQRHAAAKSYFSTIPRFLPYISKSFPKNV